MSDLTIDSMWLSPEDIGKGIKVKFIDPGRRNPKEESGLKEDVFEIQILLPNKEPRTWTMNKTSQRAVAKQHGMDNKKWIDKEVELMVVEQNVRGEIKGCIYVKGSEPTKPKEDKSATPT